MIQQLESESWIEQAEALHYLGEHRVRMAAKPVRSLLEAKTLHPWTRGQALLSLSHIEGCLLYTSPSPRDATLCRMPSSA